MGNVVMKGLVGEEMTQCHKSTVLFGSSGPLPCLLGGIIGIDLIFKDSCTEEETFFCLGIEKIHFPSVDGLSSHVLSRILLLPSYSRPFVLLQVLVQEIER